VIEEDIQREWDSDEEESSEEASSDTTEEVKPVVGFRGASKFSLSRTRHNIGLI
jgi:hypothetical protein